MKGHGKGVVGGGQVKRGKGCAECRGQVGR